MTKPTPLEEIVERIRHLQDLSAQGSALANTLAGSDEALSLYAMNARLDGYGKVRTQELLDQDYRAILAAFREANS